MKNEIVGLLQLRHVIRDITVAEIGQYAIAEITLSWGMPSLKTWVTTASISSPTDSNANTSGAPDGTLRLINDGDQATAAPDWEHCRKRLTLWLADIYVFDDSQEMISCDASLRCHVSTVCFPNP